MNILFEVINNHLHSNASECEDYDVLGCGTVVDR